AHGIFQLESLVKEGGRFHLQRLVEGGEGIPLLFGLYLLVWAVAYFVWLWAHVLEYQKKHQDYRALAEGLRVQFFWNLLGLPDAVEKSYLRNQWGELEWI